MNLFTKIKRHRLLKAILMMLGIFVGACYFSFVEDDFQSYLKKLAQFLTAQTNEKVYLHLDKPYYAVGDDIWFKAYITTTDQKGLSDKSKILYVELMNEKNQIVQSVKLPITAGIAWGDFQLNDKLEEGNYRIRAYTQYMRNFDSAFFFNKSLLIGKSWSNQFFLHTTFKVDAVNHKVQTHSRFYDANNRPIAKMNVSYQVEMDGKTVSKSGTKTDENGNIDFNVSVKEGKTGIITYQFTDSSGRSYTRFIPLQNQWDKQIQFFPEGGDLVLGLSSVVAFKATNASGKGVKVNGKIVDESGTECAVFEDTHLGMGQFNLTPEKGKTYTAQVKFDDGSTQNVTLPTAKPSGVVLHVSSHNSESFQLAIKASEDYVGKQIKVIGRRNHLICYASKSKLTKEGIFAKIPYEKFLSGVVTFTVLNEQYLPVAERIVFNRQTTSKYELKILNLKPGYRVKEKVNLEFELQSADTQKPVATYSVAVTNSDILKPDLENESHILTYQWLTGDLRGYVENPNYYLNTSKEDVQTALDNLLLTQGWRNFDWKLVNSRIDTNKVFPVEKGIVLKGKVLKGKAPVANGKITIFNNTNRIFITDTTTDSNGEFELPNLVFTDTAKFLVQARTNKDKKYVDITITNPEPPPIANHYQSAANVLNVNTFIQSYVDQSQKYFDALTARGFLQKTIVLESVTVVGQREGDKPSRWNLAGGYDFVVKQDVLQNCFNLLQCLQGRVPGLMVRNNQFFLLRNGNVPMQVYLDGMPVDGNILSSIVPQNVKNIEVLTNPSKTTVYGSMGAGGVLIVNSKSGTDVFSSNESPPGLVAHTLKGYTLVRNFYQPPYDAKNVNNNNITDRRLTIFWKPDIVSSADGKFSFTYFNADMPANYRVVVEGMDIYGNIVRGDFAYKVDY